MEPHRDAVRDTKADGHRWMSYPDDPERRAFPRYPVDLDAGFQFGDSEFSCRIANLCIGGALIQWVATPSETAVHVGDNCHLRLSLPEADQPSPIHLDALIVHFYDCGFGARFVGFEADARSRLRGYLASLFRGPEAKTGSEHGRETAKKLTFSHFAALSDLLADNMDEALWKAAETAPNDQRRGLFNGAAALLARAQAENRFQEALRKPLFDAISQLGETSKDTAIPGTPPSGLELVDKDGFELWLAKAALVNRIEKGTHTSLTRLRTRARQQRLQALPLEPQGLVDVIEITVDRLGIESDALIACLEALGDVLPAWLDGFYAKLATALDTGTLSAPAPLRTGAEPAAAGPRIALSESDTVAPISAPPVTGQQLAQLLTHPATPMTTASSGIGTYVEQALAQNTGQADEPLPPQLEERVEVTDHLLNTMLDDPRISADTKTLIQRLSLRFLAAAVSDNGFFGDSDHPLVSFVDRLEHLALFLPEGKNPLGTQVERLTQQVLDADDSETLDAANRQLAALEKRLGRELQSRAQRIISSCEGRERIRDARRHVRSQLNQAFAGQRTHKAVAALIDEGWRALLQLVLVKDGVHSGAWKKHWDPLLALHTACGGDGPGSASLSREQLLAAVREGLAYIGYDPFHNSSLVSAVDTALHNHARGNSTEDDYLPFEAIPPDEAEEPGETPPPGKSSKDWQQFLERAEAVRIGATIQLRENGNTTAYRLLWKAADSSEWVLINPRTMDARTMDRISFAATLQADETQVFEPEEQSLSARATDATLAQMQERIAYHETHDPLTGLKNRRQLAGALNQALSDRTDAFHHRVLAFLDLDHFEAVNGTCGYTASEKMLVAASKALEIHLEEVDCLAYLGGSRFGLLAPVESDEAAGQTLELLRHAMELLPFYWNATPFPVTASIGLVLTEPDCDNPEQLLSAADAACTAALRGGGNRIVRFREEDKTITRQRERMEGWIRAERAVKEQRLRLRGQAIAPLGSGDHLVGHYEVLLSVYDEQGEPLALDEFISSAEAFNLMDAVDRQVIDKALSWLNDNFDKIDRLGGLAINLSGQSLGDAGLITYIRDNLDNYCIPPGLVSFEVTETAAIANLDRAVSIIDGIKAMGCRFALDDFGTGMSSYTYLKQLPVDYIKIDGSFIKDILGNPDDEAIVKSISEIAHFMGKETIAEYVENQDIVEKLRRIGIDYVQGYAVEKPRLLDDFD